jgi:hypothetical protein
MPGGVGPRTHRSKPFGSQDENVSRSGGLRSCDRRQISMEIEGPAPSYFYFGRVGVDEINVCMPYPAAKGSASTDLLWRTHAAGVGRFPMARFGVHLRVQVRTFATGDSAVDEATVREGHSTSAVV